MWTQAAQIQTGPTDQNRTTRDSIAAQNPLDFSRQDGPIRVIPRISGSNEIRATAVSTPAVASLHERPRSQLFQGIVAALLLFGDDHPDTRWTHLDHNAQFRVLVTWINLPIFL